MNDLVYPRERTLGTISLVLGVLVWLALIIGTFGIALVFLVIGYIIYLFIQSSLIAHIKGNGVELSPSQFPDLYAQFAECCQRLQMEKQPAAYVLQGNGGLNAFATKFLGAPYVVLLSDVVDAMREHSDGVRFYLGHELGHLRMKHLGFGHLLRWPVLWLPLLGAAYSRARESTCDRHGRACSGSAEGAARALAALAAGSESWKQLNVADYIQQSSHSSGFWMSYHELTAGYPWLTKRVARVMDGDTIIPRRNGPAYLLAAITQYVGRTGGGFGLLVLIYVVAIVAAVALPAYQDYTVRATLGGVLAETDSTRDALGRYYESNQAIPASLEALEINAQLTDGSQLSLDTGNMVLTVRTQYGEFLLIPAQDEQGGIVWECTNGEGLPARQLPSVCYASE